MINCGECKKSITPGDTYIGVWNDKTNSIRPTHMKCVDDDAKLHYVEANGKKTHWFRSLR